MKEVINCIELEMLGQITPEWQEFYWGSHISLWSRGGAIKPILKAMLQSDSMTVPDHAATLIIVDWIINFNVIGY